MEYKDINYFILKEFEGIYQIYDSVEHIEACTTFINEMYETYLMRYTTYKKMLKKRLGITKKYPLYLHDDLFFIRFDLDDEIIYVNYSKVFSMDYNDKVLSIVFKNGFKLIKKTSYYVYKQAMLRFMKLYQYVKDM